NEDAGGHAETARGVGDGDAVIAARGGGDARRRHAAGKEIVEGATRLERTGVLQELELQCQRHGDPEGTGGGVEDGGDADMSANTAGSGFDILGRYGHDKAFRLL